ncbi:MAG: acetyl-CoA carboxylase biotin carboxyl carrier protein subunit [Bacteroidia bacterium]|nr:acetyl-CoA carboxylase biotin carboxyl carrier protein subunit [Bacteroidia bacterium]
MIKAILNNREHEIVFNNKERKEGTINSQSFILDLLKLDSGKWHILKDNQSFNIEIVKLDKETKQVDIKINNKPVSIKLSDRFDALLKNLGIDNLASTKVAELKAPMPGLVLDVMINEGDTVAKGDALIILEAMKMENIIKSPTDGIIKKINVQKSLAVEKNQVLISFQ